MSDIGAGTRWLDTAKTVNDPNWRRVFDVTAAVGDTVTGVGYWQTRSGGVWDEHARQWAPTEDGLRKTEQLPADEFRQRFQALNGT